MKKIRFVFKRGHPNWRTVCRALGAEFIQIKDPNNNPILQRCFHYLELPITITSSFFQSFLLKKTNGTIYLTTGIQPVFLPLFMRKFKKENNKIIVIANDASFYLQNKNKLLRPLYKKLFTEIDGVIAISPMIKNMAQQYVKRVAYIMDPLWRGHKYFSHTMPDFTTNNLIHVGDFFTIKGTDLTAKVAKRITKALHSKCYFLGRRIKENLEKRGIRDPAFVFPGYQDPLTYFPKVKFYIQIARLEAGGTAVLEAMAAGIVPFVNERVGHSNIVAKIDKDLIVSSNPEVAAQQIIKFVKKTPERKIKQLSQKCRNITRRNDPPYIIEDFKKALKDIIKDDKKT